MSELKCPICGEILQKYGEVDSDTGTGIVLGASCCKCGIGDSDIKLWQALIDTKKKLDIAVDGFAEQRKWIGKLCKFQDIANDEYLYEILTEINDRDEYPYKAGDVSFNICEPVSEDLIYKGEE